MIKDWIERQIRAIVAVIETKDKEIPWAVRFRGGFE